MRSTLILSTALLMGCNVFAQTSAERDAQMNSLPVLRASIYGQQLSGEREVSDPATLQQAMRPIKQGDSFQLTVELINADGSRTPVTNDPRIRYAGEGCFLISAAGFVSATLDKCIVKAFPTLHVALVDGANNRTLAWNSYYFRTE